MLPFMMAVSVTRRPRSSYGRAYGRRVSVAAAIREAEFYGVWGSVPLDTVGSVPRYQLVLARRNMVREITVLQVGQCGNQIGRRFWTELLHESAQHQDGKCLNYDTAMSAFFRNVDCRHEPETQLDIGSELSSLRARALLIDTEQGVLSETLRDPLVGDLFKEKQLVKDSDGAGNNWAHGFAVYGPKHQDKIEEATRCALEACDSPQAFLCIHSVGGGTGSGLGSFVLELLRDNFPGMCRLSASVYPSGRDEDVITAPYNAVLATQRLTHAADCIVPLENHAMQSLSSTRVHAESPQSRRCGFDEVNDVAAQLLSHLTAGARYSGRLNIDINEISTNLVPFAPLKYITAGFAPLLAREWETKSWPSGCLYDTTTSPGLARQMPRLFSDACAPPSKLIATPHVRDSFKASTLACALFARGNIVFADIVAASERLRSSFKLPGWNPDGLKVGLCTVPPLRVSSAVLCLENSTAIARNFENLRARFNKLHQAKAMLHHYTRYIDADSIKGALSDLDELISTYNTAFNRPPSLRIRSCSTRKVN